MSPSVEMSEGDFSFSSPLGLLCLFHENGKKNVLGIEVKLSRSYTLTLRRLKEMN